MSDWRSMHTAPPAPSGEGEPHTLKNLRAKRVALGFDPVYDMVYPLYCDECTAAANTLELHLKTGCAGTFREPEPEPCGTCGGTGKVPQGKARKGERFRTALMGICPDCATREGDA